MKAFALLDLGEVQAAGGNLTDAQHSWQAALDLFDAKEAAVPASMARDLLRSYAIDASVQANGAAVIGARRE